MLIALARKKLTQHPLMKGKHLIEVPKDILDELIRFAFSKYFTGSQRLNDYLHTAN